MNKKTIKKSLLFAGLVFSAIMVSSCTASFCNNKDTANIMYPYDRGTTTYSATYSQEEYDEGWWLPVFEGNTNVFRRIDLESENSKFVKGVIDTATSQGISVPSTHYWFQLDQYVLEEAWTYYEPWKLEKDEIAVTKSTATLENIQECLTEFGYVKFYGNETNENVNNAQLFGNWDYWTNLMRRDSYMGIENCPTTDFETLYKNTLTQKVAQIRTCIATTDGKYGNFGDDHSKVNITSKDWGYAWSKGFLEGLLVYPVAWLLDVFALGLGMNGWGQIFSIIFVTFIVRGLMFLITFKSTLAQQKMSMLQPELAKLQQKYPNSNTNEAQKQRLAQEQMALYKKHKINPFGQILIMFVQFPIFIAVWGAMTGAAVLSTDSVLNLYLSSSIWETLQKVGTLPSNDGGWWTALVLFILMAVSQFISMKLPQWMQKRRTKNIKRLSKNPAEDKSQKQMKWFSYIMLVMIIVMGFTLPAGMGVYWLIGALFSIVQTLVTQTIIARSDKKHKR